MMKLQLEESTGALLCRASGRNRPNCRILPWSRGLFAQANWDGVWEPFSPEFPVLDVAQETLGCEDFVESVPREVRKAVQSYSYRQWHLLRFAQQSEWAQELVISSPNLAWLACDLRVGSPEELPMDFYRLKRKEILSRVLGRKTESGDLRILDRVWVTYGNDRELYVLLNGLRKGLARFYGPGRGIPIFDFINLGIWGGLLSYPFGLDALKRSRRLVSGISGYQELAEDVEGLGDVLTLDAEAALKRCKSVKAVRSLHDAWTLRLNRFDDERSYKDVVFPLPPIAGSATIQPLTTPADLFQEGREMYHCVGSYIRRVAEGNSYIYRVMEPQRATLSLVRSASGFQVSELQLKCNLHPSVKTEQAVRSWLANSVKSA